MRINRNVIYFFNLQWLLLSSFVAFLDLFTKHLVMSNYMLGKSVFIFPFMNFYYIYNFGIAFSLFSEFGIKQSSLLSIIVIFIIFLLCTVLCCCIGTAYTYFFKTGYSMVVGGAIGNLIDRIRYGVVTDFIDFHIWNWHFPTFNVADLSIFIGVVMMILHNYR